MAEVCSVNSASVTFAAVQLFAMVKLGIFTPGETDDRHPVLLGLDLAT